MRSYSFRARCLAALHFANPLTTHALLVTQLSPVFPNTYIFEKKDHPKRLKRHSAHLTAALAGDGRVEWAEQQVIRPRDKRGRANFFIPDPIGRGIEPPTNFQKRRFNDELWQYQWYITQTENMPALPIYDLRVSEVWDMGITGKGVVVSVLDDGIEHTHTDLIKNYVRPQLN